MHRIKAYERGADAIEAFRGDLLGRILLHRPPVACDVEAILDAAAESRVAIEINGDPFRLDIAPEWAKRAHARGSRS